MMWRARQVWMSRCSSVGVMPRGVNCGSGDGVLEIGGMVMPQSLAGRQNREGVPLETSNGTLPNALIT
jgi:hypothetical protein